MEFIGHIRLKSRRLAVIVVICVALAFSVATADETDNASDTVRVGVYQNKPKVFIDEKGKVSGLFIDILEAVAERENWKLEYVPCQWSECLTALEQGRIDLMPDMAYSRERDERFDFHQVPVVESWSRLYDAPGVQLHTMSDVNGKRVALLRDSIQQAEFTQMMSGFGFKVEIVQVDSLDEAFRLAQARKVDVAVANHFFGDYFYREYGLGKSPVVFQMAQLFFATAEGRHPELLQAVDRNLNAWRTEANSPYYVALSRWMERSPVRFLPQYVIWIIGVIAGLLLMAGVMIWLLRLQVRNRTKHLLQANQDLKKSEERYRRLFETMEQGVVHHAADGAIFAANPAAQRILGLTLDQLQGHTPVDICWKCLREDGSDFPGREHPAMEALRTGRPQLGIVMGVLHHSENQYRWILVDAIPEFRPGGTAPYQVFTTFTDITERKRVEQEKQRLQDSLQQAQKMETVGRLAGGIAHDFNNLLQIINLHAELGIEKLDAADPLRKNIECIVEAGERAAALTNQLLAFSRKQVLRPVVLDMNKTVQGLEKMLRRLIGENIEIATVLGPDLGKIKADQGQIGQVVLNLAVNARDAMPDGGKLTIETANIELDEQYAARHFEITPGPYVMLAVSDTGCGMDEKIRESIFEPFFTTKEQGKGTGLGLSTVHGIVKQSGGDIWVYSEPGQGTTFKIFFPREDAVVEETAPVRPIIKRSSAGETILIVEDEENVRNILKTVLEAAGHKVLVCADPDQALSASKEHDGKIHLLLTDVVMPQMNGRQLAEKLIVDRPEMKILYMSGYTDDAIVHHGVLEKGTNFISKPFAAADLLRKVRELLDI